MAALGFDPDLVARVDRMIASSEFKRQVPPIAKLGPRTAGVDYLYPAAAGQGPATAGSGCAAVTPAADRGTGRPAAAAVRRRHARSGTSSDITLRPLEVLARRCTLIAAEDTRLTRRLLDRHGIATRTISYHARSGPARAGELLEHLRVAARTSPS